MDKGKDNKNYIVINPLDNVAVALDGMDIPRGHKFALTDIPKGADIIKYGSPIGHATQDIPKGAHVHTHNMETNLGLKGAPDITSADISSTYVSSNIGGPQPQPSEITAEASSLPTFMGYKRMDGRIGIRNEIWIIPTVGCIPDVAKAIETKAREELDLSGVDGVFAFSHPYGCSQLGGDKDNTEKILAALSSHPNAGGVLLMGLGCENSGIDSVLKLVNEKSGYKIRTLICQDSPDEIFDGLSKIKELIAEAAKAPRTPCPVSDLTVGVKCGGSDGLSGITANPLVGLLSDKLTALGGKVVMSEIPEAFGAEHVLIPRAANDSVGRDLEKIFEEFKDYYKSNGLPIYENPSPGNKEGGITTLEDKSLGCVQKAGTSPISGIIAYGEILGGGESQAQPGIYLVSGPGNDLVSTTALAAAGAQLILFTTGRGTPYGSPVPTVKISTNSDLTSRKPAWIDFDAGRMLSQDQETLCLELWDLVLSISEGKKSRAELSRYKNMTIFKQGVTL